MINISDLQCDQSHVNAIAKIDTFKGYWAALDTHTTGLNLIGSYALHGQKFHTAYEKLGENRITLDHSFKIYQNMIARFEDAKWREADHVEAITDKNDDLVGYIDTAAPDNVKETLASCLDQTQEDLHAQTIHPLIVLARFYGTLVSITPFETKSQKLAALLTQILMFQAGYTYIPYASLDGFLKARAHDIYNSLKSGIDSEETFKEFLSAFLAVLNDHALSIRGTLSGETAQPAKHLDPLSGKIMSVFQNHTTVTMKTVMEETKGRRATLKVRLSDLVDKGYIKRHGAGRGAYYALA